MNGSGKSTLLKCLCNFLDYKGSIKINGNEIRGMKPKDLAQKITILSQQTSMYFDYKVIDVIKFGLYSYEKFNINDEKIYEVLKNIGIHNLKDKYMSELSGGERQKVYIGRVFVQNPDIILLDEFNNNLDIKSQIHIVENLNNWFKDKILISVFHDLNLVRNLNSKVIALKDSKIYKYGDTDEVFCNENLREIYEVDVENFMRNSLMKWEKGKYLFKN